MKMGKLCYLCDRKASKTENISLHGFPKNSTVRQKWLNVCGLTLNDDVSHVCICSIHFAKKDIKRSFGKTKSVITPGAVPSMFITNPLVIQEEVGDLSSEALTNVTINDNFVGCEDIMSDIEIKVEEIKIEVCDEYCNSTPMKRKLFTSEGDDVDNITSAPNDNSHSTPKRRRKFFEPRYISEITTAHVATPKMANRVIKLIKATDQKKSKQIKNLQDRTRKLKKRIKFLQDLVSHLKNKKMISEESGDTLMEKVVKKNEQRKSMSQSYVIKQWNREDAKRALKIENEYNMKNKVNAQRLILKFPDTELNKDIVRLFHPGILNIHFQNPCGPRYCFIQMAKNVDIDEAIKDLEKIEFGTGFLKVWKIAVRNEDVRNTKPEDINPYNLYIGNLPKFVKANEINRKFPKARVDVSRARNLKNPQSAFMRYNSVDDAIADYKKAYGLMWDTRSIIVKFRRKEGNAYLPEELKPDVKKVKEEPSNAAQVEKEQSTNHIELKPNVCNKSKEEESGTGQTTEDKINHADKPSANQDTDSVEARLQDNSSKAQRRFMAPRNSGPTSTADNSFASLIVAELEALPESEKRSRKQRILQILYEPKA